MMTCARLRRAVEDMVGSAAVWEDETAAYQLGSIRPRLVVQPATSAQAAAVVALAGRERLALVPWGQGTQMHLGQRPQRYDLALSLTQLRRVLEYDRANLTLVAEAGLALGDVYKLTLPERQFVPLGHAGSTASLGGLLVTNTSGVKRLRYGSVRDLVLGVRVVLADGAVVHFGGRVVKNVAGYDMTKLFIGSLGVFGVVLETTWRLVAVPEDDRLLVVAFPSLAQAAEAVRALRASALLPSAILLLSAEVASAWGQVLPFAMQPPQILLGLNCDGFQASVARQLQEARALCRRAGGTAEALLTGEALHTFWSRQEAWCHAAAPAQPPALHVRLGVLPAALEATLAQLAQVPAWCPQPITWLADAGQGQIWARVPLPGAAIETYVQAIQHWLHGLREQLRPQQGYAVISSAPPALQPQLEVWGPPGGAALLALYKQRFDPHTVLNPGRYASGL